MAAKSASNSADSESRILSLEQAQSQTSKDVSERLVKIEGLVERQEGRNQSLLYAVVFALVFIVITVAVEVMLSNRSDTGYMQGFYERIQDQQNVSDDLEKQILDVRHQFDLLRARNSYLK
ncbi:MAG TPA: hypothetical protein VJH91_00785 [Candidatus Paceibacterota bacterium]